MPTFNNRENRCIELADGEHVWVSRSCGVVGIVIARMTERVFDSTRIVSDRVLLTRRGSACVDHVGKYCMPCGFLDYDETLYDACRREIWEEAGIDVSTPTWVVNSQTQPIWVRSEPNTVGQTVSCFFKFMTMIDGNDELPIPSFVHSRGEVDDVVWVPMNLAITMDLAFDHARALRRLHVNAGVPWSE